MSDSQLLIDQLSYGGQRNGKVAVIDIGSNSVRLVIYDGMSRIPLPIYNEKSFCTLGRGMASSNRLHPQGVKMARQAVARSLATARVNRVSELHIIATAAVRDADDGKAFVKELERTHRIKIKVISGKKEAEYAALGIVSGHYEPKGLVADMGGGSLELTALNEQEIFAHDTLPLGALRLLDRTGGRLELLHEVIERNLNHISWLETDSERYPTLYAVGGSFRSLAKIHQTQTDYPLELLNDYTLSVGELMPMLKEISDYDCEMAENLPISSKRQAQMPVAARMLIELLERSGAKQVVFSTNGIREGLLFSYLSPFIQREDPLLASCDRLRRSFNGQSRYARDLFQWMTPLLGLESESMTRLRIAACMVSHLALYVQRPHRAVWAYHHLLQSSVQGVNHAERVALAAALYHRYRPNWNEDSGSYALIDDRWKSWAALIGAAMRLGYHLSGGSPGNLPQAKLRLEQDTPKLRLSANMKALQGETLDKRLTALTAAYQAFVIACNKARC